MTRPDYSKFIGRLPYASEIFGLYRPMLGWDSKRKRDRMAVSQAAALWPMLSTMAQQGYNPAVKLSWGDPGNVDVTRIEAGRRLRGNRISRPYGSAILEAMADHIEATLGPGIRPKDADEWATLITDKSLAERLKDPVSVLWLNDLAVQVEEQRNQPLIRGEEADVRVRRVERTILDLSSSMEGALNFESAVAGLLRDLVKKGAVTVLDQVFFDPGLGMNPASISELIENAQMALADPFSLFDPTVGLPGVSISPIGIVHLFRQYFFEFDTFLGPAVGHVWLSPGASVELIESSTRRTMTERTVETEQETRLQTERTTKDQDEISRAIKSDNRSDSKLGFSTTVTQGWGTGNATATASLNLDTTQQLAREETHKRMREQSEKVSTDIRSLYKTTFKSVTEVTDVSSKRYVLANTGGDLINYEMRRKMRQVGVQVQDIGTYLCWETFVDEPGAALGLADLVHIAKPADLTALPNQAEVAEPPRLTRNFDVSVTFSFPNRQRTPFDPPGYIALGKKPLEITIDEGYELEEKPGTKVQLAIKSVIGEDSTNQRWPFVAELIDDHTIQVGVIGTANGTIYWPHSITFALSGTVHLVATAQKKADVATANKKILDDKAAATREQQRASETAYYTAAKERVEQASQISQRPFEDLREEERTVVYRALIRDLMAKDKTTLPTTDDNYDTADDERRHLYSTVLNSIFDIDKMLYFVAPEWWKPRKHYGQFLGKNPDVKALGKNTKPVEPFRPDSIANWSDGRRRDDNYYITAKSLPGRLGSSLGWLLQLDGDDNRNRFLNAPWVRAVIPIRPGKELAAIHWLQKAEVEGVAGLDSTYAEVGEHAEIIAGLTAAGLTVSTPPTVADALTYLCLRVTEKHTESSTVQLFPDRSDLPDEDKVWSVPLDKVYEHGFYPLERSFRVDPRATPGDTESSRNFQMIAQWSEILPTDQIVPVPVEYDPITGRQKTTV